MVQGKACLLKVSKVISAQWAGKILMKPFHGASTMKNMLGIAWQLFGKFSNWN